MTIEKYPFGKLSANEDVTAYILKNNQGMEVHCLDYGCIITKILVPDRKGIPTDVVLGRDKAEEYETGKGYLGAFIGRYANRIRNARFDIDGKTFELPKNNGENHLHGCFSKVKYEASVTDTYLEFYRKSPDGEDGFPGNLDVRVRYSLSEQNELRMEFIAETDAPTVLGFTNHTYFNLAGHGSGTIENQLLKINADKVLPCGADLCPTGELLPVSGTAYDFQTMHVIGEMIDSDELKNSNGYDNCFVLNNTGAPAAEALCNESGISLKVYTDLPGIQFYTANGLPDMQGKDGVNYGRRSGFALEAENFPCSPNFEHFPSALLRPGEVYRHYISFCF